MLKSLQRILTLLLLLLGGLYLAYQGFLYMRARSLMPTGMDVAGVDVSGMSRDEAADAVMAAYAAPVEVVHQEEQVSVNPADVGFTIDLESMLQQAQAVHAEQDPWLGFVSFLLERPFDPAFIPLEATHDREALVGQLEQIASILDQPAQPPQISTTGELISEAEAGVTTDVTASLPAVEAALYRPLDRRAHLLLETIEAPEFSMEALKQNLERQIQSFEGVGSVFVMDLASGEEIGINSEMAISGLSILKIAIFIDVYRVLDAPPNDNVRQLLLETATQSSNYGANLLLHVIAGENNTYLGVDKLTEFVQRLGLENTFMAVPYDAPEVATRANTQVTPANSRPDLLTIPDPARQTTAEDIGTLLSMLYYCSKGGGALLAVYPDQLTPAECQEIIDLMVGNTEGNLIRFGVPEEVPVSHKHGWDNVTHGDAGLVFSPGGDYVIVTYLHQPGSSFLVSDYSFPILWDLSRTVYNFFNRENPNLEDPRVRAEREAALREAAETAVDPTPGAEPVEESGQ